MNFALDPLSCPRWLGANHQIKMGGRKLVRLRRHRLGHLERHEARVPQRRERRARSPRTSSSYSSPLRQKNSLRTFSAFFQDRLTYPRITLNLGVRWNYSRRHDPGADRRRQSVVPARHLSGHRSRIFAGTASCREPAWCGKLTRDGKNVAKASFSRYAETMYTQVFDIINPNIIRTAGLATYQWFGDRNGNGVIDRRRVQPESDLGVQAGVEHDRSRASRRR